MGQEVKIAFIGLRSIGPLASGGIEKAIEELSTRFVKLGHDVTVFCRARYAKDTGETFKGVHLKALPAIYTKHLEAISNTIAAIVCTLRGFDVIHINATGPALLSFMPRLFGQTVVVTVHGLDWKREKWGTLASWILRIGARAAIAFPQRTVVVSRTLKRHYQEKYGREVAYIPNGVNLPEPLSAPTAVRPGLEQGGYMLFLGRLVPEKGCHTLIEAFRGLDTDKKLVIVGEPSHSEDYARTLRQLVAGDSRIIFTGSLFGEEKDAIYRGAYLFALPSTIEGMALVLLEAMSYGKCCLCSDIDENLEVIDPASTGSSAGDSAAILGSRLGVRFKTGDVVDLRQKMEFLLRHPDFVVEVGARARDYVAGSFNWDEIAVEYLSVYKDAVA
jgi:glycosyltransferase involved in cell wall biosynthesis